jgi:NADH dehydrogenase
LNARVQLATGEGVGLKDEFVHGATIVCTIGSTTAPVIERMDSPKEKGRLLTEPDMRLRGQECAWALGDCALIVNAIDGQPSPATGQFAERQGRQCARNIVRVLNGEPTRPFAFKMLGQLCSIGGHKAVAEMLGFRLSGFLAWFTWRGVYLFKLPTWARRVQVGFDWAWLLLFPRDLSYLRTDTTDRVSHAHFEPGDVIIKQGEPPVGFYVIEDGEVEVVRTSKEKPEGEIIAVVGKGNFFGEQALLNSSPRTASVRARTPLEVVVMGPHVFTSISKSLAPLRTALTQALTRRSASFWQQRPEALEALRGFKLADFIEPAPQPMINPSASSAEVSRLFAENSADFFFVSRDGIRLEGMITLTDLVRAQGGGQSAGDFMTKDPVTITPADSALVAASAFREYGMKYLPVIADQPSRRIVGFVRARKLMAAVITRLNPKPVPGIPVVT